MSDFLVILVPCNQSASVFVVVGILHYCHLLQWGLVHKIFKGVEVIESYNMASNFSHPCTFPVESGLVTK